MGLLRWLGDRLDKRDERERLRSVITEIANVLDVEDDPTAVLRGVAGLRDARDYWREEAYRNAIEADRAECFSAAWKRCARRFRDRHNAWWDGLRDMFPDDPGRASRRKK